MSIVRILFAFREHHILNGLDHLDYLDNPVFIALIFLYLFF